jgi:tetratricopeptide (TPR) repeat protein
MAEPQTLDLLGGQIDVDQVAGALSAIIPQQQAEALPAAEAEPVQMASAEMPVEPASIEPAVAEEPAAVEPAPVEPEPVAPTAVPQVKIFEYEGQRFKLPADVTQEELDQIIAKYESTPAYAAKKAQTDKSWERENIDSESGAPISVSMVVGPSGELSDDERLKTLRNYYPDAVPYGEDNFIFIDPDSGKFTLYNAPGLDFRDVSEYTKTGVEIVTGSLGAAAGFVSGVFTGPGAVVTAPTGAVIGAGIGTEVGARLFDVSMGVFAGRERAPKPLIEEFTETGVRVGLASTGQAAGPVIAEAGKRALTGVSPTVRNAASRLIEKFESLGIEPVSAAIGRKGMLGRMGAGFEQMATAGPILQKQAERVVVQLDSALQNISSRMGQIRTVNEAGAALKKSVDAAEKRIRDGFSKKYDEVFDEIGADTVVTEMTSVNAALQPVLRQLAELPADAQPTGQLLALVKKYDALSKFAETGNMTFQQLRDLRTQLRLIRSKKISGTQGDYDRMVDDIYKGITDDLAIAANSVNPKLGAKLKAIDTERAIFADTAQKTFDKIRSYDADNQAFDYLLTSAKGMGKEGVKALQRLRENFTPEEWGDVAGSALYNLGRERAGAQVGEAAEFSVPTFMTRLSEIKKNGPEAFEALFGGTQFAGVSEDLMKLVDVVGALKEVKRYTAFSNSPGAINQMIFWQALSSAGTGMVAGDVLGATMAIGGTVLAPAGAAKVMTNPTFIKWLSTPASQISKDVSAHVARLVAIGQAEPEIQEELRQYYKAIRSYTGYTEPVNEGTAQ